MKLVFLPLLSIMHAVIGKNFILDQSPLVCKRALHHSHPSDNHDRCSDPEDGENKEKVSLLNLYTPL